MSSINTGTATATIATKVNKDAEPVNTVLTFNWDGMSEDDLKALAQQALIVKLQSGYRKNGIPETATINVAEHKVGTRAPRAPVDIFAKVGQMSAEEKAKLLALLAG